MKKILLAAAALAVSVAANAETWAVVGAYSNPSWNFEASTTFEDVNGTLTAEISALTGGFKIVDIDAGWDSQYGTSELIKVGTPTVLLSKADNGGSDPANIDFADMVSVVNNAKVTWNPATATLTVTGDAVSSYPDLKLAGSFAASNWNLDNSPAFTREGGVYTVSTEFAGTADAPQEFKIVGPGWSPEFCGPFTVDADNMTVTLTRGGGNSKIALTGEYTLMFNIETMELVVTEGSGIAAIAADSNVAPVYYNLQGVRVNNPANGMFIMVRGNEVSKVLVK